MHRTLGTLLGVLAVLGPVVLGLAGAAFADSRDSRAARTLFALCTPEGIRWIDTSDLANAGSEEPGSDPIGDDPLDQDPTGEIPGLLDCPLCQHGHGAQVVPASPTSVVYATRHHVEFVFQARARAPYARHIWFRFASRAPPIRLLIPA